MKRIIKWSLVAAAAVAVAGGGYWYWLHGKRYPSTDDAYVKANIVNVAAQVSGRVDAVPVSSHQKVTRGQLLFSIKPDRFRLRYRQAEENLALTRQQVSTDAAAVTAAKAAVNNADAQLDNDRRRYRRLQDLAGRNMASQSDLDDARAQLKSAKASKALAEARLKEARRKLGGRGEHNERIRKARTAVRLARLDLKHTRITAACDGRLAGVKLEAGDMVSAGAPQFPLVCSHRYWVYANFKETDLARIRPGQDAMINIDMYPDHTFHGIVESINPASGTAFSLLPPENATGNWVKVTQRVPVRILIVDATGQFPMRVQTSATVTIDTGGGKQPRGRSRGARLSDTEAEQLARERG